MTKTSFEILVKTGRAYATLGKTIPLYLVKANKIYIQAKKEIELNKKDKTKTIELKLVA